MRSRDTDMTESSKNLDDLQNEVFTRHFVLIWAPRPGPVRTRPKRGISVLISTNQTSRC